MFRDPAMSDVFEIVFFFFDPLVATSVFIVDETTVLRKCVDTFGRTRSAPFVSLPFLDILYKISVGVKSSFCPHNVRQLVHPGQRRLDPGYRKSGGVFGRFPEKNTFYLY